MNETVAFGTGTKNLHGLTWINMDSYTHGKLYNKWSEYNDESGDDVFTEYTVTCLVIYK